MACKTLNLWTFSGLVSAFLDLTVAYLLLCASSLAFFTSKFLGLFGLCLPCPYDCPSVESNRRRCWKQVLLDHSLDKISSVQFSVKEKYPFDSLWDKDLNNHEISHVELEGEASSDSICKIRPRDLVGKDTLGMPEPNFEFDSPCLREEERCDFKEKRIANEAQGQRLHHRRKVVFDDDCLKSVQSNHVSQLDAHDILRLPASSCKSSTDDNDGSFFSTYSRDGKEVSTEENLEERNWRACSDNDGFSAVQGKLDVDGNDRNSIITLKLELEEERNVGDALYLELDKERSAAASAADEAMAMILHLQKEKALVEMEASQYQRMVEEKAAFDAEEMNILTDILLRREREIHFLEKEVEAYRQTILENDEMNADMIVEDTVPEQKTEYYAFNSSSKFINPQNLSSSFGEEIPILLVDKLNESFIQEEIKMHPGSEKLSFSNIIDETNVQISVSDNSLVSKSEEVSSLSRAVDFHTKSTSRFAEETHSKETCNEIRYDVMEDAASFVIDSSSPIHEIRVINDTAGEVVPMDATETVPEKWGNPSLCRSKTEREIRRNSYDVTSVLPMKAFSGEKRRLSDLRRNSMSAVDYERIKIGSEVGWLRERLKVVQEGREKLNFSKESPTKQLQILEDIDSHVYEIPQLTALQTTQRQGSLPPTTSKVMPKKGSWRSSSLSVHRSS